LRRGRRNRRWGLPQYLGKKERKELFLASPQGERNDWGREKVRGRRNLSWRSGKTTSTACKSKCVAEKFGGYANNAMNRRGKEREDYSVITGKIS